MTDLERKALLPAGLTDGLAPDAAFEAAVVERLMAIFGSHGYDRVKPPVMEFEDSLLSGAGVAVAGQTFRLMDPVSQRMMGLRADITPQIARLARTRLGKAPRPLRLSYAGEVLRVRGTPLRPDRQVLQVGAELIGSAAPAADAEVIVMAAGALADIGVAGLSVDLAVPRLVPTILAEHALDAAAGTPLRTALDRKDSDGVVEHGGPAGATLAGLIAATGLIGPALERLHSVPLSAAASAERDRVAEVARRVARDAPSLMLTLDPVEHRGFEYHTGIGFTIFAAGCPGELGAGGRYRARGVEPDDQEGERATGVTLYINAVQALLSPPDPARRILLPAGTDAAAAGALRADGWVAIAALDHESELSAEARRMACSHVLGPGGPEPV